MDGYYTEKELKDFGFKYIGKNVLISRKACIYGAHEMEIGDNVRIDDFVMLVGKIIIGNYVHIAPFCSLHGSAGGSVRMKDFSGLSAYCAVYAASDDYSGEFLSNPTVPKEYVKIDVSDIVLEKHSLVGLRCVLLPGAYLAEGTVLGACSLLNKLTEPWTMYVGIPAKKLKNRSQHALALERKLLEQDGEI